MLQSCHGQGKREVAVGLSTFTHLEQHLRKAKSEGHKLGTGLQLSAGAPEVVCLHIIY